MTATAGFLLASASIVVNYHHRIRLRSKAGTLGDELFLWSLSQSQSADIFAGVLDNIQVVCGMKEPYSFPWASDLKNYASNRINMWWYTLPRVGIPRSVVLLAACGLFIGLILAAGRLVRKSAT
jgi:hypothetical protein